MYSASWTIRCNDCHRAWKLAGHWSHYEREAIESRPCPCCGAYTLVSLEPQVKPQRRPFHAPIVPQSSRK